MININKEPKGEQYRNLINYCLTKSEKFLFVIRNSVNINNSCSYFVNKLKKFLIEKKMLSEWPGTVLYKDKASVYFYDLNSESIEFLLNNTSSLYQWKLPDLPEDLCFLKHDNSPFLVSISHENDSYIEINNDLNDILHNLNAIGIEYEIDNC